MRLIGGVYKVNGIVEVHICKMEDEVEKAQFKVESSTSGTRWIQMVAPKCYNYGDLGCNSLVKRKGLL